jgi:hypothetical protein
MAEFYVVQADDGNLTTKLVNNLATGATNGNTIIVDDDAVFFTLPSSNGLIIAGKNPTDAPNIIRRSATGTNPPVFCNMVKSLTDGAWSHLGGGVWSRPTTANVFAMFAGGDNGFWGLTNALRRVTSTPAAEFDFWDVSATEVRVYTGSGSVAPPTYYSGLFMSLSVQCGFGLTNNSNMDLTGIYGAGGRVAFAVGNSGVAGIGTPTQDQFDILFTDCGAYRSTSHGFSVEVNDSTWKNRDLEIVRLVTDGGLTTSSQRNVSGSQHGVGNGIEIAGSYDNITFIDYASRNWGHCQIEAVQDSARNPGQLTMRAGQNYGQLESLQCNQAHSFQVTGQFGSAQHLTLGMAHLSGMKVRGQAVGAHCTGRCVISGFTMKDFVAPGIASENFNSWALDGLYNAGPIRALDVTIEGGYVENPFGYVFGFYDETGSLATDVYKIRHNTFVDITHRGDATYRDGTANNATCPMRWWAGSGTVNDQIIEYNNFIVAGGNGQQLISWNNGSGGSNKYTINGVSGVTANNIENVNGMNDPANGDFKQVLDAGTYHAGGAPNANARDLWNQLFDNPASIGPLEELFVAGGGGSCPDPCVRLPIRLNELEGPELLAALLVANPKMSRRQMLAALGAAGAMLLTGGCVVGDETTERSQTKARCVAGISCEDVDL